MTQHVSPLTSLSCCQCTCGGAESLTQDRGFGSLLDSLTATPFSSGSRAGSGGMGVGDWFGFMDPLANFQLKQMLQDLRTSVDLERRLKERVQEATKAADPVKEAPNRFADAARPRATRATPATPATRATRATPATPATPAVPATPATPATPAMPATPAIPAVPAPRAPLGIPNTPASRMMAAPPATPTVPTAPAVPAAMAPPAAPSIPAAPATPAAATKPRDAVPSRIPEIKQHGHQPRQPIRPSTASTPPPVAATATPRAADNPTAVSSEHDHSSCHPSAK